MLFWEKFNSDSGFGFLESEALKNQLRNQSVNKKQPQNAKTSLATTKSLDVG